MTLDVVWICECGAPLDVTVQCALNALASGIEWREDPHRACDACILAQHADDDVVDGEGDK